MHTGHMICKVPWALSNSYAILKSSMSSSLQEGVSEAQSKVALAEAALLAAQLRAREKDALCKAAQGDLDAAHAAVRQLDGRRRQAEAAVQQAVALIHQAEMEQSR